MIKITDKSLCCGCTACMNACPAQCIVMRRDREGFDYPVANPDATLADRTAAFMMEQLDITQAEIDSIRLILLEEVTK